jgi:uncharacterized membrane protein (DUF373 family)
MPDIPVPVNPVRLLVVKALSRVEDVVYIGLGLLLAISALALLGEGFRTFILALIEHTLKDQFVPLLDQILLILLFVELLYTVQVSFSEHGLAAEPFLVVALIAVIRRVLVVTAEAAHLADASAVVFIRSIQELALLTVMVVALVGSFIALQKHTRSSRDNR